MTKTPQVPAIPGMTPMGFKPRKTMGSDTFGTVPCWHPSQNRKALTAFLNYAEARVPFAPIDQDAARAALSWLRGMLTPEGK